MKKLIAILSAIVFTGGILSAPLYAQCGSCGKDKAPTDKSGEKKESGEKK